MWPRVTQTLIPEELLELRTRSGLRQGDLAERASVPLWLIRHWEEGRAPIPLEHREQLRALLESLPGAGQPLQDRVLELVREQPRTRYQLDVHEDLQGVGAGIADPNRHRRPEPAGPGQLQPPRLPARPLLHAGAEPPK